MLRIRSIENGEKAKLHNRIRISASAVMGALKVGRPGMEFGLSILL
jgi:hypothetical protein